MALIGGYACAECSKLLRRPPKTDPQAHVRCDKCRRAHRGRKMRDDALTRLRLAIYKILLPLIHQTSLDPKRHRQLLSRAMRHDLPPLESYSRGQTAIQEQTRDLAAIKKRSLCRLPIDVSKAEKQLQVHSDLQKKKEQLIPAKRRSGWGRATMAAVQHIVSESEAAFDERAEGNDPKYWRKASTDQAQFYAGLLCAEAGLLSGQRLDRRLAGQVRLRLRRRAF